MSSLNNRSQFYRNIIRIALPIAVQSLISSSLSLIDNLMVGSLGEAQLAAVGAGVQVFFVYWMFLFGFNSGAAAFNAQFWGVQDLVNIRRTIGFAMKVSIGTGLVFFTACNLFPEQIMKIFSIDDQVIAMGASYIRIGSPCFLCLSISQPFIIGLRATQQPKLPLFISAGALVANTVLNFCFIFGVGFFPRLETDGAALATVFARVIEMSLLLYVVFGRRNLLAGRLFEFFHGDRKLSLEITKKAIPTTLNELLWSVGQSAYMAAIGHISVTAYAAAQASSTIQNMFIMAGFSIGEAALILLGAKLGSGRVEEAKAESRLYVKLSIAVGIVSGALLIAFSKPILSMFEFTEDGHMFAQRILLVYGCTLFINLYDGTMISGLLRGGGDTAFAAISEVGTVWCIGVPLAFIGAMVLKLPVYYVVLMIKAEEFIKAIVLSLRYKSGKWAKNIIDEINIEKP